MDADGYMAVTPEYNHSISAAMKNTLDYFLEEYYFKPSSIVSYSPGAFGGINAAQHLRNIFAELEHRRYLHPCQYLKYILFSPKGENFWMLLLKTDLRNLLRNSSGILRR